MKLNDIFCGNYNAAEWEQKGYELPKFDIKGLRENISCKIPAGTQPDTTLRLRGKGVKNSRTGRTGDMYVQVKLLVPTNLTDGQKELLRAFGDPPVTEQPAAGSGKKKSWSDKVKDFFD